MLLWIDLRLRRFQPLAEPNLCGLCKVVVERRPSSIQDAVACCGPRITCFDFDYPYIEGLQALQRTKLHFPAVPVLMMTEQHSEALAIWAFRTGVRDYLVKPLTDAELTRRVKTLLQLSYVHASAVPRNNIMLPNPIPPDARFHRQEPEHRTALALAYAEAHLHERISVNTAAERCDMSPSGFSHAFTQEHGIPFREFLLHARLKRARELLRNPMLAIADVAALSGFQDQAYFDRVFRRYLGTTPSRYRRQLLAEKS